MTDEIKTKGAVIQIAQQPGRWGAVPEALIEDNRLGLEARAVAAWLAIRPPGWQLRIQNIQDRLGLSKYRWLKIARELENAKYLCRYREADPSASGSFTWTILFSAIPADFHTPVPSVADEVGKSGRVSLALSEDQPAKGGSDEKASVGPREAVTHLSEGGKMPSQDKPLENDPGGLLPQVVFEALVDRMARRWNRIDKPGQDAYIATALRAEGVQPTRAWIDRIKKAVIDQEHGLSRQQQTRQQQSRLRADIQNAANEIQALDRLMSGMSREACQPLLEERARWQETLRSLNRKAQALHQEVKDKEEVA